MGKTEILDIVDKNGKVIGKEDRDILHHSPDKIHSVVHILIVNSKGEVLIQKRSAFKKVGAGLWDISAGGHIKSGERASDTAKQELKEELGITIPLRFIAKRLFAYKNEKELSYLYFGKSNGPFTLDYQEVEEVKFVMLEEAKRILKTNYEPSVFELWLPVIESNLVTPFF